jgi:hypothetical protein
MKTNLSPNRFRALVLVVLTLFLAAPLALKAQSAGLSGSLETSQNQAFVKEPSRALLLAFFPGLLIHGYGHFYAKDKMLGTTLLGGEIISLAVMGFGLAVKENPEDYRNSLLGSNAERRGKDMILYGALFFGLTWVADVAHAPTAARNYNMEHNLQPAFSFRQDGSPTLALAYRF